MTIKKLILSSTLIIGVSFFSSVGFNREIKAEAMSENSFMLIGEKADAYIEAFAEEWVNDFEPNLELDARNVTPIYDIEGKITGYTADYFIENIPYGYIVVENVNGELVPKEFSITGGTNGIKKDIIEEVKEENNGSTGDLDIGENLVEIAPMQYGVAVTDKKSKETVVKDNYGNQNDDVIDTSTVYNNATSIFIKDFSSSKYQVDSSQTIVLKKAYHSVYGYKLLSQDYIKYTTGKYACTVTALTQIAYMEGLMPSGAWSSSLKSVYNKLWIYAGCDKNIYKTAYDYYKGVKYKYVLSGNYIDQSISAFVRYAKEKGYINTTYDYANKPSVSWLKSKLKNQYPTIMGYTVYVKDSKSGVIEECNHEISVLGYKRAKKVSSGNTYNYLMVFDGWHDDTVRYLNYTTVDFRRCQAASFILNK